MAKSTHRSTEVPTQPQAPLTPPPPAAAAHASTPIQAKNLVVRVQLAPAQPGKYVSRRCDTDLTQSESHLCRRIQDAIEASGRPCKGPAGVLKYLLAEIAAAEAGA